MNATIIHRILALYLVGISAAVFFNLILTPVYHDGSSAYPVWEIMNWVMAPAVVLVLAIAYIRRRDVVDGPDGTEHLRASLGFYGAVALAMLFFWGFLWVLNPDSEAGDAVTSHIIYFPLVDALFSVMTLSVGCRLWRKAG